MEANESNAPLRVGIVGAGAWARQAHVPGFQRLSGVQLVAICDVDESRAQVVAEAAGIPRAYASAEAMFAAESLDVVSIVTPDDCHRPDVELAIGTGLHVLCEKPLATTLADARALAALADAAGIKTRVGFAMRCAPAMRRLREMVVDGAIGEPQLLQAFQQNGQFLDPATPLHWKMDRQRTGGGAVVEYGIHTIDLARWIMGEAASACATSRTWIPERPLPTGIGTASVEVDDSTAWLMNFASGAIGMCHAGWATAGRPPGLDLRVFGSRGAVRCELSDHLPGDEGLWIAEPDGHFQPVAIECDEAPAPGADPWWSRFPARLIHDFMTEIEGGHAPGPTFADGVLAQEILEALQTSVRERRWVDIPSPMPDRDHVVTG